MKFLKLNGKRSGMVLSEVLIALLVSVLVLGILQQTLKIIKSVPDNLNANQIRWHMTNEYIQDRFKDGKLKTIANKKLVFEDKDNPKSAYILEFYQNMLRVRSEQGGHVPLITSLRSGSFQVKEDVIVIKMINNQNKKSEMYLTNDHQNFKKR